jgi:hypothetical protein
LNSLLLFFFGISFVISAQASPIIKGYQDTFYQVDSAEPKVCEFNSSYIQSWCLPVLKSPIGLYVGFKQLIVFSRSSIQSINLVRRVVKWSIPLDGIYKLHINYPVIVTFSQNGELTGYDYFTGYQLWKKPTQYVDLFESDVDLWMVSSTGLDKLDVVSSEIIRQVSLTPPVSNVHGDELYLFVQLGSELFHYNLITKTKRKIGHKYKVLKKVSDYLLVGNDLGQQIRTLSNDIVSENVQQDIFVVHTPTKTLFTYIDGNQLSFVSKRDPVSYQFTRSKNDDKIDYGYKLNDKVRVFTKNGHDVWILKHLEKKESDHDT